MSKFKSEKEILEYYSSVRDAQIFLQNEICKQEFERSLISSSNKDIQSFYLDILRKCKNYYSCMYRCFKSRNNQPIELQSIDPDLEKNETPVYIDDLLNSFKNFLKGRDFLKYLEDTKGDKSQINNISFSIIPSLFNFFLTGGSVEKYFEFLNTEAIKILEKVSEENKEKARTQLLLMFFRPLFWSPLSISFIRKVLPILLDIADNDAKENEKLQDFNEQFVLSCPSFIRAILSKHETISEFIDNIGFDIPKIFEIFIINLIKVIPQIYDIITLDENNEKKLNSASEALLAKFANLKNEKINFGEFKILDTHESLNSYIILNGGDSEFFNKTENGKKQILQYYHIEKDTPNDNQSVYGLDPSTILIRNLLKTRPLIPNKLPSSILKKKGLEPADIFKHLFPDASDRINDFQNSPQKFNVQFNQMKKDHLQERKSLIELQNVNQRLKALHSICNCCFNRARDIIICEIINSKKDNIKPNINNFQKAIDNFQNKNNEIAGIPSKNLFYIIVSVLFSDFEFQSFLNNKKALYCLDSAFLNDITICRWNVKNLIYTSKIKQFSQNPILDKFAASFKRSTNLFTKALSIYNSYINLLRLSRHEIGIKISKTDKAFITEIILLIGPENFISSYLFLNEYLFSNQFDKSDCIYFKEFSLVKNIFEIAIKEISPNRLNSSYNLNFYSNVYIYISENSKQILERILFPEDSTKEYRDLVKQNIISSNNYKNEIRIGKYIITINIERNIPNKFKSESFCNIIFIHDENDFQYYFKPRNNDKNRNENNIIFYVNGPIAKTHPDIKQTTVVVYSDDSNLQSLIEEKT